VTVWFYDLGNFIQTEIDWKGYNMRKILIAWLLAMVCLLTFPPAGLSSNGEKLYIKKFCVTCHGETGISVAPNYPSLANQNLRYISNQVKDILSKKRDSKLTLLMTDNPVIMALTDQEIQAISKYLNQLP